MKVVSLRASRPQNPDQTAASSVGFLRDDATPRRDPRFDRSVRAGHRAARYAVTRPAGAADGIIRFLSESDRLTDADPRRDARTGAAGDARDRRNRFRPRTRAERPPHRSVAVAR